MKKENLKVFAAILMYALVMMMVIAITVRQCAPMRNDDCPETGVLSYIAESDD